MSSGGVTRSRAATRTLLAAARRINFASLGPARDMRAGRSHIPELGHRWEASFGGFIGGRALFNLFASFRAGDAAKGATAFVFHGSWSPASPPAAEGVHE